MIIEELFQPKPGQRKRHDKSIKRIFDVLFSCVLIVLFTPLTIISALIIFFQSYENPFYVQKRSVFLGEKSFKVIKIKTLFSGQATKSSGVLLKQELCKRIIPFGRFLRHTGIDELPQLINVLFGQMSLVGPRPLTFEDLQLIKETEPTLYNKRTEIKLKPGITGYWQVNGDRLKGIKNLIEHDIYYETNFSVLLDVKIILKTIPMVLLAKHSDAIDFGRQKLVKGKEISVNCLQ